jgi:hypothetical protein
MSDGGSLLSINNSDSAELNAAGATSSFGLEFNPKAARALQVERLSSLEKLDILSERLNAVSPKLSTSSPTKQSIDFIKKMSVMKSPQSGQQAL